MVVGLTHGVAISGARFWCRNPIIEMSCNIREDPSLSLFLSTKSVFMHGSEVYILNVSLCFIYFGLFKEFDSK
jgi:hypothetical protein